MDSTVKIALTGIGDKRPRQTLAWNYYEGAHPLVFSTDRLKEIFEGSRAVFVENWIAVVVDSVLERLRLTGFAVAEDNARSEKINALFDADSWLTLADDIHESLLVTGEAFAIVDQDERGTPEVYCQIPQQCYAHYDPAAPKRLLWVAKQYIDEATDRVYLVLYYPDRIETYIAPGKTGSDPGAYELAEDGTGPVSAMPVFHFRAASKPAPSFTKCIPIQDALNKQFADLMVTSDFAAFPMRYAITSQTLPGKMAIKPGMFLELAASGPGEQAAAIGQLPAAELRIYTESMDRFAGVMANISHTPKHYFTTQQGEVSGEALQAMEAPLIKRVERVIARVDPVWCKLAAYCLTMMGMPTKTDEVAANFDDPKTVQTKSQAETRKANVEAGIPIITILKSEGWRESEINDMLEDAQRLRGPVEQLPVDGAAAQAAVEKNIAPLVESTVASLGDLAVRKVIDSGRIDEIIRTAAGATA